MAYRFRPPIEIGVPYSKQYVKHLLDEGFYGSKFLCDAIVNKDANTVQLLMELGVDPNIAVDKYSPLFLALLYKSQNSAEILLTHGVNPNQLVPATDLRDHISGQTLLMKVASWKDVRMVRLLLNAGARTDLRNSSNQTALDVAKLAQDNEEVIQLLSTIKQGENR